MVKNMRKMMMEDHQPRKQSRSARPTVLKVMVRRKKMTPRQTFPADLTDMLASNSLNWSTEKKREVKLMTMLATWVNPNM